MQRHPKGRQVQVPRRWAAEQIAKEFCEATDHRIIEQAEAFLKAEEVDSGIVVRRGDDISFWHLTFQEYLTARAIAAHLEEEQHDLLLKSDQALYTPEWREVVLLLGGVLYQQGRAKVDGFVKAVLEHLPPDATLIEQARAAGLLGALVRDLSPFNYQPPADAKYGKLMNDVKAMFDPEKAKGIPVELRIEVAEALGMEGDPHRDDESQRWVELLGGKFPMYDYDPDGTTHWVEVEGLRMGRWPVTVAEYARFVEEEGYRETGWWAAGCFGQWNTPDEWEGQLQHLSRPVVYVSWYEAMAYCAWLTERGRAMGLTHSPPEIARLPTEAEWEYAAAYCACLADWWRKAASPGLPTEAEWRGHSEQWAVGRGHPWGDEEPSPEHLNFNQNVGHPTPVGIYPAGNTPVGLQDMAGNVWEWCWDWDGRGDYSQTCGARKGIVRNPKRALTGESRVQRGGSWIVGKGYASAAIRNVSRAGSRESDVGFRVVLCDKKSAQLIKPA
jgi:formylglycine-generating enzyme required for sulfatase activity